MTHIKTGIQQPGIIELLFYKSSTGRALSDLAHALLHGPSNLTSGERELIAAYVSKLNNCEFCFESHCAAATAHFKDEGNTILKTMNNLLEAPVSDKMKALLNIAGKVQKSGRDVSQEDVEYARKQGAEDEEIHDTVLIAAAFCMYNRYVDGLGTNLPRHKEEYKAMGERMASKGYKYPPVFLKKLILWMMGRKSEII